MGEVYKTHDFSKDFKSITTAFITEVGHSGFNKIGARINAIYDTSLAVISWNEMPNQGVTYTLLILGVSR